MTKPTKNGFVIVQKPEGSLVKQVKNGKVVKKMHITNKKMKQLVRKTVKKMKDFRKKHPVVKTFSSLQHKPAQPKHGISYAVEKGENIDAKTGKKNKGDVFKKYNNGVLKRQVFVPKSTVKKIIQNSLRQMKKITGGLTKKAKKAKKAKIVYVQAPVDQAPVGQAPPPPVVIQNDTGLVQAARQGLGTGLGAGAGAAVGTAIGNAVVGLFSSDE